MRDQAFHLAAVQVGEAAKAVDGDCAFSELVERALGLRGCGQEGNELFLREAVQVGHDWRPRFASWHQRHDANMRPMIADCNPGAITNCYNIGAWCG